jgi:stage II sporulation protein D
VVYVKGMPYRHALLFFLHGASNTGVAIAARACRARCCAMLLALLCLAGCGSAMTVLDPEDDAPSIRVRLSEPHAMQSFFIRGEALFTSPQRSMRVHDSAAVLVQLDSLGKLRITIGKERPVTVEGSCRFSTASPQCGFSFHGRWYSDTLIVVGDGPAVLLINALPLESYLLGVVPNEIGRDRKAADLEAVKAQAILARTYALDKIRLPLMRAFDVYDDTRDQVFSGAEKNGRVIIDAVRETAGEVLEYEGRLAECYFHSACGGRTEAISRVWRRPQSKPYLAGIADGPPGREYCRIAPSFRWTEEYSREEFESMLRDDLLRANDSLYRGIPGRSDWSLLDIKIRKRMPSGRVAELKLVIGDRTDNRSVVIEADNIRRVVRRKSDGTFLRSGMFDVTLERDEWQWITRLRLLGAGAGHGVGMCQWGAIGRARSGQSARRILQAYFPGTDIARRF